MVSNWIGTAVILPDIIMVLRNSYKQMSQPLPPTQFLIHYLLLILPIDVIRSE